MKRQIIPALWNYENILIAKQSKSKNIFILGATIGNLREPVIGLPEKNVWIDLDMMKGINPDYEGIKYIKALGYYGIITVKSSIVGMAKNVNLKTVQRFFAIDSMSLKNGIQNLKRSKADYIEVLPGIVLYDIINEIRMELDIPVIAAGLIQDRRTIEKLFDVGVSAISTSKVSLWEIN
jgi:glycerol uptake operon antiterminator